jgi:hypothetical protein
VISPDGNAIGDLILENSGEITGIYISHKVKECIFFTEKNFNGIFKVRLSAFYSEIEKLSEIKNTSS